MNPYYIQCQQPIYYQPQYNMSSYQINNSSYQVYQLQNLNFNNQTSQERHEIMPPVTNADKGPEKKNFHTLMILNVPFNIENNSIYKVASQFGEIAQYQHFPLKGYALLTYFDLRVASKAFNNFAKIKVNGNLLKANFAKERSNYLTSIILAKSSKKEETRILTEEIQATLTNFGAIYNIEEGYEIQTKTSEDAQNETNQKVIIKGVWYVIYFDTRDAQKCANQKALFFGNERVFFELLNQQKIHEYCIPPPIRKAYKHKSPNQKSSPFRNFRNSESIQKVSQFKNASKAKDTDIFDYLNDHTEWETRREFDIGFYRLKRIQRQIGLNQKRRRKITKEQIEFIIDSALNGIISSTKILRNLRINFENISISKSTVIRILIANKFRFRKPRHMQFLTNAHKLNRYNFAFNMLLYYRNILTIIVFSDESRFCQSPDNRCIWLRSNDFRESRSAKYSKYTFGTMVWAAIGKGFKSKLIFPKGKIDGDAYRKMLDSSNIFNDADQILGKYKYIFQQDGAPSHSTKETYEHIEKSARVLYGWPANSCDLSPIEMIWAIMKNYLQSSEIQPNNQEELEIMLLQIWEFNITQDLIDDLILSFENRLVMCRDLYGGSISQFLSAGRKEIKSTDLIDRDFIPRLLTNEDVKLLYEQNKKTHHRWKRMSEIFQNTLGLEPKSIKHIVTEIERKINDYKKYPDKYSECPTEIRDFIATEVSSNQIEDEDEYEEEEDLDEIDILDLNESDDEYDA